MYTMLLIYLLISVGISFLCSIMEAVYLSTSESFVRSHKEKNDSFSKDISKFAGTRKGMTISAILTLNTFAHTIGASGVGAEATSIFRKYNIDENLGLTITSILLTLIILIFSEIIPKQLGNKHWKKINWRCFKNN
jgi:Mg2+/Co2+ transporter CorB